MSRTNQVQSPDKERRGRPFIVMALTVMLAGAPPVSASPGPQSEEELTDLSLEQLMNVEVTLATKRIQRLFDTAAAIYVITQEDLRRSGATSIPEALRMVPGLHVARAGSSRWAISSRGFTDLFSNKLLVLVDGRSVYTPLFAGVFWDSQGVVLEDVERIEVIRGPGATLWGANAVNGVINIVTRSAGDSEGALIAAGAGNEALGAAARFGGSIGSNASYKVYGKAFDRDGFADPTGGDAFDQWSVLRGGARLDWHPSAGSELTLQGEAYDGEVGHSRQVATMAPPFVRIEREERAVRGGHVLGRYARQLGSSSDLMLQLYFDRTDREETGEKRNTIDFEAQHSFDIGDRQQLVWGVGYRRTSDSIATADVVSFSPLRRSDELLSAFIQDEVSMSGGDVRLIVGSKFEHNDYTGFEIQPNGRLLWEPSERHVLWAAVSRAVRTPSRGDSDINFTQSTFPGGQGTVNQVAIVGNPAFRAESLMAYELGYRVQPGHEISFDLATFYNDYDDLRTFEPQAPAWNPDLPGLVFPQRVSNLARGNTYGLEIAANWKPTERVRLGASYTGLRMQLEPSPESRDTQVENAEGDSPKHQLNLRSWLNLPWNLEFDAALYYSDALPGRSIPSYTRLDLMLGWQPTSAIELRLVGQNLLEARHAEFAEALDGQFASEVERSVHLKLTLQF